VAVQTTTFVSGRYMGQAVGGFEGEFFKQFHAVILGKTQMR
jgi:hypothetical protein